MCRNGDLRLVDGKANGEGRVEICFSNTYGSICADFWDEVEAQVVCGQLGFLRNGQSSVYNTRVVITLMIYTGSHPSRIEFDSETDVFLSEVDCDGNEVRLIDCSNSADSHCDNDEVAGVRCEGNFPLSLLTLLLSHA